MNIKPDNVMLVPDPVAPGGERAKLLDFGIARLAQSTAAKTATNLLMGTPRYMSPEQCRGTGQVDDRTDVYSLGVMLFEMLAGRVPFEGTGGGELIAMHLTEQPPALLSLAPHALPPLAELTHRLLLKDRLARPFMAQVVAELGRLRASVGNMGSPAALTRVSAIIPLSAPAKELQSTLGMSSAQKRSPTPTRRKRVLGTMIASGSVLLLAVWGVERLQSRPAAHVTPAAARQPVGAPPPALPPQPRVPEPARSVETPPTAPEAPAEAPTPPPRKSSPPLTSIAVPAGPGEVDEAAPAAKSVRWNLASEPAGASVLSAGGKLLGKTPYRETRAAATGTQVMVLRHDGYEDLRVKLSLSADESRKETLRPSRAGTTAEPRKPAASPDQTSSSGLKGFPEPPPPPRKPSAKDLRAPW